MFEREARQHTVKQLRLAAFVMPVMLAAAMALPVRSAMAQYDNGDSQPGAARASLIQGSVSMQRGDNGEWDSLTPNTPLFTGDSVSTGPGARTEIQLDFANVIRLSDGADVRIANLSPSQVQVQVGDGEVSYSELKPSEAAVEIDTPNVAVHPLGVGNYSVEVEPSGETRVVAWYNAADIVTPQGTTRLQRGQMMVIQPNLQYQIFAAPAQTDWDRWNVDRDRTIANAASWQNTSPYYVGSYDLDSYGQWIQVPEYGNVWCPTQTVGWAPYRSGRWVWEPFYGWTWVSYEPWGWAPYHYGRWFVYRNSWVWWPGPVREYAVYRPVWAPAYVSFLGFGSGSGFSVSFGFSNVGWLPIGPADPFFPWYGRYGGRVNIVTVNNFINVRDGRRWEGSIAPLAHAGWRPYSNFQDALRDPRVRGGFSSMGANEFGHGRVPSQQRAWDVADFTRGGLITGGMPLRPGRDSARSSDQPVNPRSVPSRSLRSERFFSDRNSPRSAAPAPAANGFNPGPRATPQVNNAPSPSPRPEANGPERGWNSFGRGQQGGQGRGQDRFQRGNSAPFVQPPPAAPRQEAAPQAPPSGNGQAGNGQGRWQRFSQPQPAPQVQAPPPSAPSPNSSSPGWQGRGRWQGAPSGTPAEPQNQSPDNGWRGNGRGYYGRPASAAPPPSAPPSAAPSSPQRGWEQSRPPLDLRQPVVTRRGAEESGGGPGQPEAGRGASRDEGRGNGNGNGNAGGGRGERGGGRGRGR